MALSAVDTVSPCSSAQVFNASHSHCSSNASSRAFRGPKRATFTGGPFLLRSHSNRIWATALELEQ